ncbi:MAG: hypothetical protein WCD12_16195 [Candidatus Binatus sp.]|jgi:hypothetical protein
MWWSLSAGLSEWEAMETASTFTKLDPAPVKRIAEDPDLEYL